MVGGLADWFAVTALFRHPLGVPLPHTRDHPRQQGPHRRGAGPLRRAQLPLNEVVSIKLDQIDFATLVGRWLADPARSGPVASEVARFLPRLLDAMGDEPMRHFLHQNLVSALRRIDLAPIAADLLDPHRAEPSSGAGRRDAAAGPALPRRGRANPRARVRERTAWLWQKLGVDDAISDRLIRAAGDALAEVSADPQHAWRQRFTDMLREYVDALRTSEQYRERAERLKNTLLEQPQLAEYAGTV